MLLREEFLRATPNFDAPGFQKLEPGANVRIVGRAHRGWRLTQVGEVYGFLPDEALAPTPRLDLGDANPYCDLGYPTSGSARYFLGLTALRTTGPLSLLLGEHVQRPCPPPPD